MTDNKTKALVERLENRVHDNAGSEDLMNEAAATIRAQAEEIEQLMLKWACERRGCEHQYARAEAAEAKLAALCNRIPEPAKADDPPRPQPVSTSMPAAKRGGEDDAGLTRHSGLPSANVSAGVTGRRDGHPDTALTSAEGLDVEGALADWFRDKPGTRNYGAYNEGEREDMSAALAVGCAPLRAKVEKLEMALREIEIRTHTPITDGGSVPEVKAQGYRNFMDKIRKVALAALDAKE